MAERDRFEWTAGGTKHLSHIRRIDSGGSGSVHELSDSENNRVRETENLVDCGPVRNEVRAIKKLCDGTHENIIHVFAIGELPESTHVFIDMELCAFNLKEYNKSNWTYDVAHGYSPDAIADRIWKIMKQIANGLVFIHSHGEVHRDIKPQNVLFSTKDRVWKLADFGLTCETTSKTFESTESARGTPGYRAPELLKEDNYKYNTKVDIWAMGCILFELVVGRKPFSSDLAVLEHYRSERDSIDVDTSISFSEASMNQFSHIVGDLLQLDPQTRPSAQNFLDEFTSVPVAQSSVGTQEMRRPAPNSSEEFGQLKTFIFSPPRAVSLQELQSLDHQKWTVSSVAINQPNTRAVTLGCNHLFTKIQVALWNTTTGSMLWSSEEPINPRFIINQHAVPTFSDGGEYLVAYVDQVVVVLDSESAKILHRLEELPKDITISAIALAPNGRTLALSYNADYSTPAATLGTQLASSSDKREGKFRIHLVATSALSFIKMAYSPSGRHLRLSGTVVDKLVARQSPYRILACVWESNTLALLVENITPYKGFTYNTSNHYNIIAKGTPYLAIQFSSNGGFSIHIWHPNVTSYAALRYPSRFVFSIENDRIMILSDGTDFQTYDCTTGKWSPFRNALNYTTTSSTEGNTYKYLLKWEPFVTYPECFARVEWGDLPQLHEIKAMAWTRSGFTLMLEDQRFVFFSETEGSVYGEINSKIKDSALVSEDEALMGGYLADTRFRTVEDPEGNVQIRETDPGEPGTCDIQTTLGMKDITEPQIHLNF